jgi:hypothetical protein
MPLLKEHGGDSKPVIFIATPLMPNAAAVHAHYVQIDHIVLVNPKKPHEVLWTMEQ